MDLESISLILILNECKRIVKKGSKLSGFLFLLFSLMITSVSAYFYQQTTSTETQNIAEIVTINLRNSELGDINEGETKTYTKDTVASLGNAVTIDIQSQPIYLHFDSNLDSLSNTYSTYVITVKFKQVQGTSHSIGDTAIIMTLDSPDPAVVILDATGLWKFDFEITTTAKSVNSDIDKTATIVVSAETT